MTVEKTELETLMKRTDSMLAAVEREISAGRTPRKHTTQAAEQHPAWETLKQYANCQLPESKAIGIRQHLAQCSICASKALRQITSEEQSSLLEQAIQWCTSLWQPQWAGVEVSANDIPRQTHEFQGEDGTIKLSCDWRGKYRTHSAFIRIEWQAELTSRSEIYARFINPDTQEVRAEVALGKHLSGEKALSSKELGFDPATEKWAIVIGMKEL